ncbi:MULTISPECIES: PEP/pyruvate-binding domain-containing protein [Arthrobacter]|nr:MULTISPECIES: PEP/pyruvate-binding domain-containing protein [Arthrobacter]
MSTGNWIEGASAMVFTQRFEEIDGGDVASAGGKGANLGELTRAGFPVPPGFVILTNAYVAFLESNGLTARVAELAGGGSSDDAEREIRALFRSGVVPEGISEEIQAALLSLGAGPEATFAVRSSATAEDLADASFAGQQDTYLNIHPAGLEGAIKDCWASLWTARAMDYRARRAIGTEGLSLAVVIQVMVESEVSGVMFTANPRTGRREEIMVSAAWGLGESVVSGAVSTDDYVVDKSSAKAKSSFIADKDVMTVYATGTPDSTPGGTAEHPVPDAQRRRAALDDEQLTQLSALGKEIEDHFGAPQDIEWALASGHVHVVQSRPITALPEPAGDAPTDWTVPYPDGLYFRASIVEQLPDPLSTLFADMIDGSVSKSITKLLGEAFKGKAVREGDVALPTINGYAYYYYRNSGMWRVMAKFPGAMVSLARGQAHMGVQGWREYSHPLYAKLVRDWSAKNLSELSNAELFDGVSQLLDGGTVYYTAVQSVIPLAATSEIVFGRYYETFVRRAGDPPALTFLLGFDSEPIRAEKSLYDLATWTRKHPGLAGAITSAPIQAIARALTRTGEGSDVGIPGADPELWQEWSAKFHTHLDRYGHAVFNLDFLNPVPADDPSPLLSTLKFYLRGQGNNPHERQEKAKNRREEQTRIVRRRLDPARRAAFDRLLGWAQATVPVREDALADIGLAWPLLRRVLLELGRRLTEAGVIAAPDDVFWLRTQEVTAARTSLAGSLADSLADAVEQRKMAWRGQRKANPPQMLPEITWANRAFGSMMPANSREQSGDTITGVGASGGKVTAPARVLGGPADFDRMEPGDVLVARMTTPAWTSLFAMASAVVTDVGGPLSHSSIVAREYGIPAVLGTAVATSRIESGQLIRVDGDAGTVTLKIDAQEPPEASSARPSKVRTAVGIAMGAALAAGGVAVVRRLRRR